jgi:hypothetical protein
VLKNVGEITIDGYASGETDFPTRLSESPAEVQDEFNLTVISPLLAVLASSDRRRTSPQAELGNVAPDPTEKLAPEKTSLG